MKIRKMEEENQAPEDVDQEQIRAAYGIVRYKILESYYKIQGFFSIYYQRLANNEEDSQTYDQWVAELKVLYLRIVSKIKKDPYNKDFAKTIEYMDKIVSEGLTPSLSNLNRATRQLFSFIDEIGLTKIEEQIGPHSAIFGT